MLGMSDAQAGWLQESSGFDSVIMEGTHAVWRQKGWR